MSTRIGIIGLALALATSVISPAGAQTEAAHLVALGDVIGAVESAHTVTISAYTLTPRGRLARALVIAANGGARVHLVLDGKGMAGAVRSNVKANAELCAATGGRAVTDDGDQLLRHTCVGRLAIDFSNFALHLKGCVTDNGGSFVSDRNWTSSRRSIILALPSADAPTLDRAISGSAASIGAFSTRKAESLRNEVALLTTRRTRTVLVETESFGPSILSDLLMKRARAGDDVTLVVARYELQNSASEQRLVASLVAAGVKVYAGTSDEKIAVDGDAVWTGSSNATAGVPAQVDWGYMAVNRDLAQTLAAHVRSNAALATAVR